MGIVSSQFSVLGFGFVLGLGFLVLVVRKGIRALPAYSPTQANIGFEWATL